jgi:hypothetical protein
MDKRFREDFVQAFLPVVPVEERNFLASLSDKARAADRGTEGE